MTDTVQSRAEKLAENSVLKLVARYSMAVIPPLILAGGAFVWVLPDKIAAVDAKYATQVSALNTRLSLAERATNDNMGDIADNKSSIASLAARALAVEVAGGRSDEQVRAIRDQIETLAKSVEAGQRRTEAMLGDILRDRRAGGPAAIQ